MSEGQKQPVNMGPTTGAFFQLLLTEEYIAVVVLFLLKSGQVLRFGFYFDSICYNYTT